MQASALRERFGPWAVVIGGSSGTAARSPSVQRPLVADQDRGARQVLALQHARHCFTADRGKGRLLVAQERAELRNFDV